MTPISFFFLQTEILSLYRLDTPTSLSDFSHCARRTIVASICFQIQTEVKFAQNMAPVIMHRTISLIQYQKQSCDRLLL